MSLLARLIGVEKRDGSLTDPLDSMLAPRSHSGVRVSTEGALRFPAVFACVTLISSSVGGMPLIVYRRDGDHKRRDSNHFASGLLHDQPNPEMAADEVWDIVTAHLLLWGNAYLAKVRDQMGIVRELWPISPKRVQVAREDGVRLFRIDGNAYGTQDVLHIRGLSSDGLVGYSPVQLMRQTMGNLAAQEQFQGKFLGQDGKPSVILRHPSELSPDAAKRLKASWENIRTGGTAVLEDGISVEKWTMPLDDAQFLEQQQFSDQRIAQMFGVPPGKIGAKTGDSLTYSTNEMNSIDLVMYTFGRWMKRVEGALRIDPALFPDRSRFPEFLADGLLRTDVKTRNDAYKTAIDAGWLTVNEVRQMENRPALPAVTKEKSE